VSALGLVGGRLERREVVWPQLVGNRLGDPATRPVLIYLPAEYDREPTRRFPVVYVLHGYSMTVESWVDPGSVYGGYLPAADTLFAAEAIAPMILVFVDGWTRFGGSQYVDSPGTGRYLEYLLDGIVPWVDAGYRTRASARGRAIQGHSSGGFGAIHAAWRRPELFGAVAPSAPDALYELLYPPIFANAVRLLHEAGVTYDEWSAGRAPIQGDGDLMMCEGVSACFSPDDAGRPSLPFDSETGRLDEPAWARWLALDPVRLIEDDDRFPRVPVFLSVGTRDEHRLDAGARALERVLQRKGVDVVVTTADTDHCGITAQLPVELGRIANAICRD
jgi:Putative esterase